MSDSNLVHSVRNLLGVIETQVAVTEISDDPTAVREALRMISECAQRTRAALEQRSEDQDAGNQDAGDQR